VWKGNNSIKRQSIKLHLQYVHFHIEISKNSRVLRNLKIKMQDELHVQIFVIGRQTGWTLSKRQTDRMNTLQEGEINDGRRTGWTLSKRERLMMTDGQDEHSSRGRRTGWTLSKREINDGRQTGWTLSKRERLMMADGQDEHSPRGRD
jgi:hypothetical protein